MSKSGYGGDVGNINVEGGMWRTSSMSVKQNDLNERAERAMRRA